jgi:regulator of sirC expression with transglutaminase-like and TPR domain/S1-C subfamily serine protease
MPHPRLPLAALVFTLAAGVSLGQEKTSPPPEGKKPEQARTVEELAKAARPSVVVIRVTGRDGKKNALGTGFVVSADGLVATNLHVIGEARPIEVQTADGKRHQVTAVHASDRSLDLALLRIDTKGLPPLEMGDSDTLRDGQAVVALGHPRGLEHSVVSGVVSGRPKIEGRPMIQLAMPIEQGNSGGPVLDLQGRVRGIVTLKAQVTPNLGFAMPVNTLKTLLKRPNPVPIARWITIGTLNPEDWAVVFDGRWRQRNGLLIADGAGKGFGGRSLCLSKRPVPPVPFEVSVAVRLDEEAGAAGLVFHADGGDQHYGFYPSNGQMRLSRFAGPDVFSWKVLYQKPSPHYKPGEWNVLKVRVEKDRLLCYVNDQLVVESTDDAFTSGKVGLAKFRTTHAEFKNFRVGDKLPRSAPSAEVVARVTKAVAGLPAESRPDGALVERMLPDAPASLTVLRERARLLERQAARLRELAAAVHQKGVLDELARATGGKDDEIDLVHAALLIARLDNEELDVSAYRKQVERLAREIAATLPKGAGDKEKLAALNKELFEGRGFHGSRGDYYNRANSYLNEVLEDREGLPITLALLYMELARLLGVKIEGVGLPGHFVVRHVPAKGKPQLIDVYEGGKPMSRADAERKVEEITGKGLQRGDLARVSKRDILVRVLYNLRNLAQKEGDAAGLLRYQDAVVSLAPDNATERLARAGFRYQNGDRQGSIADLDWLLDHNPPGLDRERVLELRRILTRPER